jgi:hypothetical protein
VCNGADTEWNKNEEDLLGGVEDWRKEENGRGARKVKPV